MSLFVVFCHFLSPTFPVFHTIQEKALNVGDKIVLLHKIQYSNQLTNMDILNRSHLLYRVDRLDSSTAYLSFLELLHTPSEATQSACYFPPLLVLLIENEYILLDSPGMNMLNTSIYQSIIKLAMSCNCSSRLSFPCC